MKVFLNPGHAPGIDSGAVNSNLGLQECDIALNVGTLVKGYLEAIGCTVEILQSDNLNGESSEYPCVCETANSCKADIFVSLHCNAANQSAQGTEVEVYRHGDASEILAGAIQAQIVGSLGTIDRGIKDRPNLSVLRNTDMPAVLVEMAFIDQDDDAVLLRDRADDFARAIARGITDYQTKMEESK
jgi:N-acetylmuramoyl-L-alanine amidase